MELKVHPPSPNLFVQGKLKPFPTGRWRGIACFVREYARLYQQVISCRVAYVVAILFFVIHSQSSFGSAGSFFVGEETKKKVWFWVQVFSFYTSNQVLVHDLSKPHMIIDIISRDIDPHAAKSVFDKEVEKYLKRYRLGLDRFKQHQHKAILMGSIEKRLYQVYAQEPSSLKRLFDGKVILRSQLGLADRFTKAAATAENYLPYMEKIFVSEGIPRELTRIAFVESMFQLNALSKVGAKGVWQLMPATARKYIKVNKFIDERNSPLKSTMAAARFLRDNYEKLQSWPLTVTSYNHGVYGMLRAVKSSGSKNLEVITQRYRSPSFKFASKNFYAEFIAAKNVYERTFQQQSKLKDNPLGIVKIDLPSKLAVSQLIRYTPVTESLMRRFNPCLQPLAYQKRYRTAPILRGYSIFVPSRMAQQVKSRLKKIKL